MTMQLSTHNDGTGGSPGDLGVFNRGIGMGEGYAGSGT